MIVKLKILYTKTKISTFTRHLKIQLVKHLTNLIAFTIKYTVTICMVFCCFTVFSF